MIPTLLGILLINFAILRLAGDPLRSQIRGGGGDSEESGLDPKLLGQSIESALTTAYATGRHLPAVINLRGFTSRTDVEAWLRRTERSAESSDKESERISAEIGLWGQGPFLVEPLYEILKDPKLKELHGPASFAFTFCAYQPLDPVDTRKISEERRQERRVIIKRNQQLQELRIFHDNNFEKGFVTKDDEYEAKLGELDAFWAEHGASYQFGTGSRWGAILFHTGFIDFFGRLFTGNLHSEQFSRPVFELIGERWQVTFWLQILSVVIAWIVAVPIGIRSARRNGSLEDQATTNSLFVAWSLPDFFVGALLLFYLCTDRPEGPAWFPNRGQSSDGSLWYSTTDYLIDLVWHGMLPMICLTYGSFTVLSRYMRGSMLDQMGADYARTARAKGCSEDRIVYHHNLRNSMVTMITMGSGLLTALFGGFIVVEQIFSINGLGLLLLDAARANDAPLVMASTIISVLLLLFSLLIADLMYAVADPRIRSRYG
jgi:peptide/nickel transport system permease protein